MDFTPDKATPKGDNLWLFSKARLNSLVAQIKQALDTKL